ncbi:carbon starvation CstA family protein [Microlunatus aurantiacus]|uniref:Carbon starvation CstA family protein n=2 Tax=Microlunatus aurantiacus TaxID=446786 RepID=A0ABP7DLW5_9ACTN
MTDTVAARELPPASIDAAAQDEQHRTWTPKKILIWGAVALLGAVAWVMIALVRGETINAIWFVFAAVCSYLIAYRFYSKVVERKITRPDDTRATPAEYKENGLDYLPTDRRVLFGHHFAAIAGAGPLVGPVLAAQMGYLPGTIWIIVGVILAGAVQDYLVLFFSMRRGGRSLGQMARDQLGRIGGTAAILATLLIMLIIVAILALVVVNALGESPWGVFSVGMTLPIALFMGCYLRFLRPGKVGEVSIIGFVLLIAAIASGRLVAESPYWSEVFTLDRFTIAWIIVAYGFFAAILPVWLLLAPRDYLSTFMKVGTIIMLAVAIIIVRPVITAPPLSEFAGRADGPVWAGSLFPFLFVTIACGALSGFHALIASGTTPKLIEKERQTRLIGYGGMLMESFVAIMALVAALSIDRGIYFAMNSSAAVTGGTPETAAAFVNGLGLIGVNLTPDMLTSTAQAVGEESIISRTGGAPTLALGLAHIMQQLTHSGLTSFWYHFAIMFEALFILTAVDAGTRVARFQLQESLGNIVPKFRDTSWRIGSWLCTAVMVAGWGAILILGVTDPLGGINTFFPLFGIANQLLAAIALAVCMSLAARGGVRGWLWIPALPLAFAAVVTITGSLYKIFSPVPAVGYWAQNKLFRDALAAGKTSQGTAKTPEAMAAVVRNTTVQGTLSIIFVTLAIIVIAAAIVSTIRTVTGANTPETEDPRHESTFFAPAGFLPTPAEKELQSEWAAAVPDRPKRRAHH